MGFLRNVIHGLFGQHISRTIGPAPLLDPDEAEQLGYAATPAGLQWSPTPTQLVDKSSWKPCHACGRLIPVVQDWAVRPIEGQAPESGSRDRDTSVVDEGTPVLKAAADHAETWTYVCPFCGNSHVGIPADSPDLQAQTVCHECGTNLGTGYQCPHCSFPRGWVVVPCPFCGNRQPVFAPHWAVHCDMFTMECVVCERVFVSFCIC